MFAEKPLANQGDFDGLRNAKTHCSMAIATCVEMAA